MKKSILLTSLFYCIIVTLTAQKLPNGDMEKWITLENGKETPEGWVSKDVGTNSTYVFCEKTDEAFSGEAAFALHNLSSGNSCSAGYIRLGTYDTSHVVTRGIPFTERPYGMSFYYKYFTTYTDDSPNPAMYARAYITLSKWDSASEDQIDIGHGELFFREAQTEYAYVEVPIEYYSDDTPELLEISFHNPCNPHDHGASFSVDFVELVDRPTPTEGISVENKIKVFPNPANNYLNVTLPPALGNAGFRIFDAAGRMVISKSLFENFSENIELTGLMNGVYSYQIHNSKKILKQGKLTVLK